MVVHSLELGQELGRAVAAVAHDRLFVLADSTTERLCWPLIAGYDCMKGAQLIVIAPGDEHKNIDSVAHVWGELARLGASRRSLMVNLGGGMVTDLGGFAASTFKRGIAFINIPTTLLAMVDASMGGKTGINLGGLKNEVGVFNDAETVIIDTMFLATLDRANLLSGYAEMIKHGLISTPQHLAQLLQADFFDSEEMTKGQLEALAKMLATSVAVKQRIVSEDPHEHGIRKALNLGHTVGHAIETFAMRHERNLLHGYAVAWGLVCELYLSVTRCGFPTQTMRQVVGFIRQHYGTFAITCNDYPELLELMTHDKKNHDGQIICTLLADVGQVQINQTITKNEIEEMLDFLREG